MYGAPLVTTGADYTLPWPSLINTDFPLVNQTTVRLTVDASIARITLNRPEQHNALAGDDIALFLQHLDTVAATSSVRALIIDAEGGRTFCAGASLKEFRSGAMSGDLFTTLTDRIAAVDIPTVCLVNGNVFGGGAEVALCCDYRIGVHGSRMRIPAAQIGLCYPINGLRRYVDKLGLGTAKRLLVAAEELDSTAMLACGFLHKVVEPETLATAGAAFATQLAGLAPLACRNMKHLLHAIAAGDCDDQHARQLYQECAASEDLQEGLAAQRERRAPVFRGI